MDTLYIQHNYIIYFWGQDGQPRRGPKTDFPKLLNNKKYGLSKQKKLLSVVNTTFVDCREVFRLEIHPEHEDEHLGVAGTHRHGDTHSTGTHVDDECD